MLAVSYPRTRAINRDSRDHFLSAVLCSHVSNKRCGIDGRGCRANQNCREKLGDILFQQPAMEPPQIFFFPDSPMKSFFAHTGGHSAKVHDKVLLPERRIRAFFFCNLLDFPWPHSAAHAHVSRSQACKKCALPPITKLKKPCIFVIPSAAA
jgi:hypothetical protein